MKEKEKSYKEIIEFYNSTHEAADKIEDRRAKSNYIVRALNSLSRKELDMLTKYIGEHIDVKEDLKDANREGKGSCHSDHTV